MEWTDQGIVLSARPHGEGGMVVALLTHDHGRHAGFVPGGGSRRARPTWQLGNLVEVSWRAIRRSDSWERRVFDQVSKGMKSRRKVAIVAVARKKLVRLWARWRDRELAQRAAAPS